MGILSRIVNGPARPELDTQRQIIEKHEKANADKPAGQRQDRTLQTRRK